jgi:hypothetical protein
MAEGQFHTPYQKGIIKRYYENSDDLSSQKLGEIVSELYLETNAVKRKRLWAGAKAALEKLGANPARMTKILAEQNVEGLAKLAEELF